LKVFFKNIQYLLIAVLVVALLLQRSCYSNPKVVEPKVITNVEIKWDTVTINKEVYIPKWKTKVITEYQSDTVLINTPIDTLEILKDFYSKNVYVDEIILDSLGKITITDTITQNSILSRRVTSNILIPTTTITSDVYINSREFYWGLGLQGRSDQLNYLGGELLFKDKNKHIYGLGLGVNQDFIPVISGRLYWKIGN
jgi:hypothetical protein